ncbi:MAG: ABC transporter permease [Gemmatimonadota bacterium]|nr:ABC transporter permease [Gemmatimonadota bacterium]
MSVQVPQLRGEAAVGDDPEHGGRELPVIVIDGSASWRLWWSDLFVYRGALQSLARRNVQSRYKQAALGVTWALLQPAIQVGVFTLLFGMLAKIPSDGVPYPLFALAGLLPWNLFQKTTSDGAQSLVTYQTVISKLYFPRIYLVLASAASALVDAAVTVVFFLAAMLWYGVHPGARMLLAIPALGGVLLFALGFAALLAGINARWRDVQHTLPFLMQVGLYVTPVIYRTSFVPEKWRWLLALNPLTALVEIFRAAALGLAMPDAYTVLASLGVSLVMIVTGVLYFRRTEATVVDVL